MSEHGRDLDLAVAFAIGAEWEDCPEGVPTNAKRWLRWRKDGELKGGGIWAEERTDGSTFAYGGLPEFSTSDEEAWKAVREMRDHPDSRFRTLHLVAYPYSRTYATFDHMLAQDSDGWCEANGEHATAHAICLAIVEATQ